MLIGMGQKNDLKGDLVAIRKQIAKLGNKEESLRSILSEKEKVEETSSGLLTLLKFVISENKSTRQMIERMSTTLSKLEAEVNAVEEEEFEAQPQEQEPAERPTVVLSGLDTKIVQYIQIKSMACADDIKKMMGYKGRNAASARLNKLKMMGILTRHQAGHKVFYMYNAAGKTTKNALIVSPPQ
jgi:hypothetical protein